MIATLVCLVALVLAWPLACGAGRPAGRPSAAERRLRHVAGNPQAATTADVERLLRAHELPPEEVALVLGRACDAGIRPFTMWCWVQQYGVHALAIVVAADLSHAQLLRHLGDGTLPDLEELAVFAALNGFRGATAVEPAPTRSPAVAAPRREPGSGLRIDGPGSWPFAGWSPGDEVVDVLREVVPDPVEPRAPYPSRTTQAAPREERLRRPDAA
ncbi:hypothetical protein AB0N29_06010 [Nocardioides sp. NPDC092400]|uniref:hypothetical protein n=1 Tax=Nocardioides sp. NPDC092400 TaxID=3155196 RepID=UPI0034159646